MLDRGLTVTGKVTDEAGKPIVGALVRTKFFNDVRKATTGPDGVYRLVGCEPRADQDRGVRHGRATDMKELNIEPGMGPVDFPMKPGGTVRIRVLDEQGNPVPKARIFFQQWRGRYQYFEFDHVNQYADDKESGSGTRRLWTNSQADICPPAAWHCIEQPLIAREEEYVFRRRGRSSSRARSSTRRPRSRSRRSGSSRGAVRPGRMFWNREESFIAADGHYEIRQTRAIPRT